MKTREEIVAEINYASSSVKAPENREAIYVALFAGLLCDIRQLLAKGNQDGSKNARWIAED
jgi:hypothetical protein